MPDRTAARAALLLGCVLLLGGSAAHAARYHVDPGGLRTTGPSVPGDWGAENVYSTVALAAAACASDDTILVSQAIHAIDTAVALPALLGNRRLSTRHEGAVLAIAASGRLDAGGGADTVTLQGLTLRGGQASRVGSALDVTPAGGLPSRLVIRGCWVEGFHDGGAMRVRPADPGLVLEVEDSHFRDNTRNWRGGAIYLETGITATFTRCGFEGNASSTTGSRGGAVAVVADAAPSFVTFVGTDFRDNRCDGPGGTVFVENGGAVFDDCELRGSRSGLGTSWSEGAGVFVRRNGGHTEPLTVTVTDCRFLDNRGSLALGTDAGDGGALMVRGDSERYFDVTVRDCLFQGNYNAQGAGVYIGRFASGLIERCIFRDNAAYYQGGASMKGGALEANVGEIAIYNHCLFENNRAGFRDDGTDTGEYSRGGAVMVRVNPRATLNNCTFLDNTVNTAGYALGDGFAHASEGWTFTPERLCRLYNCVFWGTGNDYQLYSDSDGMAEIASCAVVETELRAPGVTPTGMVWLTDRPFSTATSAFPAAGGVLIDAGLDLGLTVDLAGRPVPSGAAPDLGCYEWYDVVDVPPTTPDALSLAAWPNPFNPRTTVSCRLGRTAHVRVSIHDLAGRHLRDLHAGTLPAGGHAWVFDGLDARGRPLGSGVYLAVLQVDGQAGTATKLTLVR